MNTNEQSKADSKGRLLLFMVLFFGIHVVFIQKSYAQVRLAIGDVQKEIVSQKCNETPAILIGIVVDGNSLVPQYLVEVVAMKGKVRIASALTDIHGRFVLECKGSVCIDYNITLSFTRRGYDTKIIPEIHIRGGKMELDTVKFHGSIVMLKEIEIRRAVQEQKNYSNSRRITCWDSNCRGGAMNSIQIYQHAGAQ